MRRIAGGAHFQDCALCARAAEADQLLLQSARGRRDLLDEDHFLGAAGQGLEPERAGAGEQIQAAGIGNRMLQPIEQGLAHPIRCRPQARNIGKIDAPAAPAAADDAHRIAAARAPVNPSWGWPLPVSYLSYDERSRTPGVRGFFKRLRAKLNQGPAWLTTDIARTAARAQDRRRDPGRSRNAADHRGRRRRGHRDKFSRICAGAWRARNSTTSTRCSRRCRTPCWQILKPVEQAARLSIPPHKPFVILVVGINGAGKTTTIGKLAHRLLAEGEASCWPPAIPFARRPANNWRSGRSATTCPSSPSKPAPNPPPSSSTP